MQPNLPIMTRQIIVVATVPITAAAMTTLAKRLAAIMAQVCKQVEAISWFRSRTRGFWEWQTIKGAHTYLSDPLHALTRSSCLSLATVHNPLNESRTTPTRFCKASKYVCT